MINLMTIPISASTWLRSRRWSPLATKKTRNAADVAAAQAHFHSAFHQAYRHFAQTEPTWVQRRFDDQFLRQVILRPNALPTSLELAWAWDQQFGVLYAPPVRLRQVAELTAVATTFLRLLAKENAQ